MRKWLSILLLCLLPVFSCNRETEPVSNPLQEDGAPDGRVSITFSVSLPESSAATKALGESSQLNSMYLAVFGSSGHYKEYVKAEMISGPTEENRTFNGIDEDGNPTVFTRTVEAYQFKASIQLSNSPRTIHFLGNGPLPSSITIGDAVDILPNLLCNSSETAFWQMIYLPEITAATNEQGQFLNPDGNVREDGQEYKVSPETLAYFQIEKDENGNPVLDEKGNQQGGIALIRNWAKIVIRNSWKEDGTTASNFVPYSFAVVNVPKQGTFVPYGGKTGFIGPDRDHPDRNYQSQGFDELNDADGQFAYPGNLPEGTAFNHTSPTNDDFVNKNTEKGVVQYDKKYDPGANDPEYHADQSDKEPAVYLYERPAPSSTMAPSYVIVYGRYKNPEDPAFTEDTTLTDDERVNGVWCYYKVDLMANGKYYPIYRNFKYQIQIRKISSRGHATPEEAAASAGSADVSADVTASHLADISDGKRRMAIRPWMSYTFIEGDKSVEEESSLDKLEPHLYVKFYDDITQDDDEFGAPKPNFEASSIWFDFPSGSGVIYNNEVSIGAPVDEGPKEEQGWRPIRFRVNKPGDVTRTQTLRILCKTDPGDEEEMPLYRDIVLSLLPKQTMKVTCEKDRVLRIPGESQEVQISIPDGLVESMFPLVFLIEPQDMTLTPFNDSVNLPVVYGESINPALGGKPRFHFERTLTWEDYRNLGVTWRFEDESRWKTFTSHFKTNCEYSGTVIYVADKKNYFYPDQYAFSDYRSFKAAFTKSIPREAGKEVSISLGVQKENNAYLPINVELTNLTWAGGTTFTPEQDNTILTFTTTGTDGNVSIRLSTDDDSYEPVTLEPWHFSNVGFVDAHYMPAKPNSQWGSNVVRGQVNRGVATENGKNVLFGYYTDPGNPTPVVSYNVQNINSPSSPVNLKTSDMHKDPYSGEEYFYWATMTTFDKQAVDEPASITLSAVGYVEETVSAKRFDGYMLAPKTFISTSDLKNHFSSSKSWSDINLNDKGYAEIIFEPKPDVSDEGEGLILSATNTYTMSIEIYKKSGNKRVAIPNGQLYYVQFDYAQGEDGVPLKPLTVDPTKPEESIYYKYPGSSSEYIWYLPPDSIEGEIKLKAPNLKNAVIKNIRLMAFQGTLQP